MPNDLTESSREPDVREECIRIAGISMRLRSAHTGFWRAAERRYDGFFSESCDEECDTIELRVEESPEIPYVERAWTGVEIRTEGDITVLQRGNVRGEWSPTENICRVVQDEVDFHRPILYREYGCDTFVRIMLARRARERGGLFVHSAAVSRDGRGYLFVGYSGAGKSTLAKASGASSTILTDDAAFVDTSPEVPQVYGTPFFGDFGANGPNIHVPLSGVYFLHKATTNRVVPIERSAAVAKMLPHIIACEEGVEVRQQLLDLVCELCEKVPAAELHFLPDASFWSLIDGRS